jgi:DNA-binding PadR family transcriptional regulator
MDDERFERRRRHHHQDDVPPWVWRMGRHGMGPADIAFGRGRRVRRGDVRWALLAALQDGPKHGYEVIREVDEKSGGRWRPSPGSVYPTLQLLQDEGLLRAEDRDGKRVYELTDEGRRQLQEHVERSGGTQPWDVGRSGAEPYARLGQSFAQLAGAMRQIMAEGNAEHIERAEQVFREARKQLYELLATA